MLIEMRIENFILIDQLTLQFEEGLNIFTGETGAGKSMIIGALNAGLGDKVTSDIIRSSSDKAIVQLVFSITNQKDAIEALGISLEEDLLIITREVHKSNRSIIRINDRAATLATLRELSNLLMDVHGQHAHQALLYPKNHLKYLDLLGGSDHQKLVGKVENSYNAIKSLQKKIEEVEQMEVSHLDEDYLRFQLSEIESVNLTEEDELNLEKKYEYYKHLETIHTNIQGVLHIFSGDHEVSGIKTMLEQSNRMLGEIENFDEKIKTLSTQSNDISYQIDDMTSELRAFIETLDVDEQEMYEIEQRMNTVSSLKVKYGKKISDILSKRDAILEELQIINHRDEKISELNKQINDEKKIYIEFSKALSEKRLILKSNFEEKVQNELKDLNMKDCSFEVSFVERQLNKGEYRLSPKGFDEVEFMISTNPGMPAGALSKIASGGEISRIMLAIKLSLSNHDMIDCLVFDEVDTGISGTTALVVGEKIHTITKKYQVICITHLPQIAVMADKHFILNKKTVDEMTTTQAIAVRDETLHKEIARMLSGNQSQIAINAAIEMLHKASKYKKIS